MGFDVTLPQDRLESLLRAAGRAVSGRAPQPVLQGLLLETGEGSLTATGYDLATGIRASTTAAVATPGAIVAPYRMLSALVGALPDGVLVRLADAGTGALAIEAGEGRYSVALSHEAGDFPELPTLEDSEPIALPFGAIKRALQGVAYALATEEHKQVLQGVHFHIANKDLRLIGADGQRGSIYNLPGIAGTGKDYSFVVPGPAVKELLKLALSDDDLLLISHTQAHALFDGGDATVITHLLAGDFPPFAQLLPKTCDNEIISDRQGLISAVERASIVANSETGAICIEYDPSTGDMSISAANDTGSAADLVASETGSKSTEFKLNVSARYLLDALRHTETSTVSIAFNETRLLKVQPVGSELHRHLVATMGPGKPKNDH